MKAPVDQGADAAIQLLDSMRDHVDCLPPLEPRAVVLRVHNRDGCLVNG